MQSFEIKTINNRRNKLNNYQLNDSNGKDAASFLLLGINSISTKKLTHQNVADFFGLSDIGEEFEACNNNVNVLVLETVTKEWPKLSRL